MFPFPSCFVNRLESIVVSYRERLRPLLWGGLQAVFFELTPIHKPGKLRNIMGKKSYSNTLKLTLAMVLVFSTFSMAQMSDQAELERNSQLGGLGQSAVSNPFSLLDLSRIKWSHSYSVSYFSGGGASGSGGMWQTSMFYEFSSKLSLNMNLGIAHTGNLISSTNRETTFLPGFTLDYHPSNKFSVSLMFQTYRGNNNPYAYRSSLWHNPIGP